MLVPSEACHIKPPLVYLLLSQQYRLGKHKKKSVERITEAHRIDERTGVPAKREVPKAEVQIV